jgi:hypothetical protein
MKNFFVTASGKNRNINAARRLHSMPFDPKALNDCYNLAGLLARLMLCTFPSSVKGQWYEEQH